MDYDIQPTIDYLNWLVFMYATVLCFDIFEWCLNVASLQRLAKLMFCNCLRLGSSPEIAYLVNEEVLTKAETMTIREMFAYIKQESAKVKLLL